KRYAVDGGQWAVDESVIGREEVAVVMPLADQQIDGRLKSLFLRTIGHRLVELGIDCRILNNILNSIELQHVVEKGASAILKAGRRNHPLDLLLESRFVMNGSAARSNQQLRIGRRVPKEER